MPETSTSRLIKKLSRGGHLDRKPPGYSYLSRKLDSKSKLKIIKYLEGCRDAVIEDLGGESSLSAQKLILVDRLISLLGVIRGIEEFFEADIIAADGTLRPSLGKNYISYVNSTRLILCSLGLEKGTDAVLTPLEIAAEIDRESAAKEKATE